MSDVRKRRRTELHATSAPDTVPPSNHSAKFIGTLECWDLRWTADDKRLLLALLAFRVSNALVLQTSYVPDEYWQALEVAHHVAFDYGYLTWEWRRGLRSYLYPLIFAAYFRVLAFFGLDTVFMMTNGSRVIQALFACLGDFFTYHMSLQLSLHQDEKEDEKKKENNKKDDDNDDEHDHNCQNRHKRHKGVQTAGLALACQLVSWYHFYASTRTVINSLEALFVATAMYYLVLLLRSSTEHTQQRRVVVGRLVVLMSVATIVRPTTLINWSLVAVVLVVCSGRQLVWLFVKAAVVRGGAVLLASLLVDRMMYGAFTNVLYNFVHFNLLYNQAHFYGIHSWHWYLTQGLPVLCHTHLLLLLPALLYKLQGICFLFIAWPLLLYSTQAHKEFRFLTCILPFVMHVSASSLYHCFEADVTAGKTKADNWTETDKKKIDNRTTDKKTIDNKKIDNKTTDKKSDNKKIDNKTTDKKSDNESQRIKDVKRDRKCKETSFQMGLLQTRSKLALVFLVLSNLPLALYFSLVHQRGGLDVMDYLRNHASSLSPSDHSILFLLPCHTTPLHSHLHLNISLSFLTCEPPPPPTTNPDDVTGDDDAYVDEADAFYADPVAWIRQQNWSSSLSPPPSSSSSLPPPATTPPTCVVMFQQLFHLLSPHLPLHHSKAVFFHTHFPEGRLDKYLVVACRH